MNVYRKADELVAGDVLIVGDRHWEIDNVGAQTGQVLLNLDRKLDWNESRVLTCILCLRPSDLVTVTVREFAVGFKS